MSAAPSAERGQNARRWVAEVVRMHGGVVQDSFTVAIGSSDSATEVADKAEGALRHALDALDPAP